MFRSLRSFLASLEESGHLRHVEVEVDKDWEIACVARWALESRSGAPPYALQFDRVRGHAGAVVVGAYATRAFCARALGTEPEEMLEHWRNALRSPLGPTRVEHGPVREERSRGEGADVRRLPVPVWTPGRDAGPYLSAAAVITADRESGVQNAGVYRVQVHGPRRLGLFFGSDRQHGAMHFAKYRAAGEPMPVAVVLGAPPAVAFAAAAKTVPGCDELELAGGLSGEPIDVVTGETVDLAFPARAECVIEGFVPPEERLVEAPFGEALGYMNAAAPAPFIEVTAISQRRGALHQGYVQQLGPSEGHLVWELGALGPLWHYLVDDLRLEGIGDLAIVPGAAGLSMLAVQVEPVGRAQVRRILDVFAQLQFGQKMVIAVDADVDPRDSETLHWALSSRVDPATDVRTLEDVKTYLVDPSVLARNGLGPEDPLQAPFASSMLLIDATLAGPAPDLSLPLNEPMQRALARWAEYGLPAIEPRERLRRLLGRHRG